MLLKGVCPISGHCFTEPSHRGALLRNGWKSVGKIFIVAFALDAVYQAIELHWFYPGEALLTAFLLAIVPYILLRGPANRIIARFFPALIRKES
jgi:hypothetical protein